MATWPLKFVMILGSAFLPSRKVPTPGTKLVHSAFDPSGFDSTSPPGRGTGEGGVATPCHLDAAGSAGFRGAVTKDRGQEILKAVEAVLKNERYFHLEEYTSVGVAETDAVR
jgi:hypothetical protein